MQRKWPGDWGCHNKGEDCGKDRGDDEREQQFDEWEKMRQDAKRRQKDDRRLNLFGRKNKTFPAKFGIEDETPDPQETLDFWRSINNKEVNEGWREDRSI